MLEHVGSVRDLNDAALGVNANAWHMCHVTVRDSVLCKGQGCQAKDGQQEKVSPVLLHVVGVEQTACPSQTTTNHQRPEGYRNFFPTNVAYSRKVLLGGYYS